MPKSTTVALLTGLLILLLAAPVIFQVSMGTKASVADDSKDTMISGVLAHDMNESEAKLLAANRFYVEADVELGETSPWQTIYNLSKQYNIALIGKLLHKTMNGNISAPDNATWVQTIQTALSNYGDIVKYWEIWNEPTDSKFFNGTASEYTGMLKLAYQTIKAIQPDAVVIGLGGLHLYSGENTTWVTKGLDFAGNVTELGGMEYCDAISLHAYPWENYTVKVGEAMVQSLEQYRTITEQKPIWITETGQHAGSAGSLDYDEKDQAGFLYNSYKLMKSQNVSAYIWYELGDQKGELPPEEDTFGLFDRAFNPRLAFQTYVMVKSETSDVNAAVDYLVNSFNPDVGLFYETPDNNGATYWLYTDNYLAQLALAPYAQNESIAQILGRINDVSGKTNQNIVNQYQILNGSAFTLPINCTNNYKIAEFNGVTVNCTVNNGTGTLSSKDYADVAFLEAIAYHNANQTDNAKLAYDTGAAMWDGTGFVDSAYNSIRGYDTFKLALYIYASNALNHLFDARAYNNLMACQLKSGVSGTANRGGFATYYTANGCTNSQTNTETTALAVLALTYTPLPVQSTTSTPTPTPTITSTPTPTPTITPTPTPTQTPTDNPTPTPTASTSTPTPSPTPITPTPTPPTPTPTQTPPTTISPTPQTATPTATPPVSFTADPLFYIAVGASVAGLAVVGCVFLLKKK